MVSVTRIPQCIGSVYRNIQENELLFIYRPKAPYSRQRYLPETEAGPADCRRKRNLYSYLALLTRLVSTYINIPVYPKQNSYFFV